VAAKAAFSLRDNSKRTKAYSGNGSFFGLGINTPPEILPDSSSVLNEDAVDMLQTVLLSGNGQLDADPEYGREPKMILTLER
jgi:hypothetical protein